MRNAIITTTGIALAGWATAVTAQPATILGVWRTEAGSAQIRIERCRDASSGPVCGSIVGLSNATGLDGRTVDPEMATDWRNADPALRSRKILGSTMLWGFKGTTDATAFTGGTIYNGSNGKTYSANITLLPDGRLQVRGYVGTPLLGESQVWTRVE